MGSAQPVFIKSWGRHFNSSAAILQRLTLAIVFNEVVIVSVTAVYDAVSVREIEGLAEGVLHILAMDYGVLHDHDWQSAVPVRPVLEEDVVDFLSDVLIKIAQ